MPDMLFGPVFAAFFCYELVVEVMVMVVVIVIG